MCVPSLPSPGMTLNSPPWLVVWFFNIWSFSLVFCMTGKGCVHGPHTFLRNDNELNLSELWDPSRGISEIPPIVICSTLILVPNKGWPISRGRRAING